MILGRRGALALAAAALAGLAGCSSEQEQEREFDPGIGHIHGLGINPADGELYAGTHYGIFRITESGVVRVGDVIQDFMGFAVVGPDHFLASGHPSPDDTEQPINLGLIESTDGGASWETVSLSGSADFHALEFKHGNVYGYDSTNQQVMVSEDKVTWTGGARFPASDLAVSPVDPAELIATVQRGPARSTDRGRVFEVIDTAPALTLIDWPRENQLFGIDEDGTLYRSRDGGDTWEARGSLDDPPHAFLATDERHVYVATARAVYQSSDGGTTFSELYEF
ncbi:F510_1955 family glycosylhydrolase [Hoyosella altamirensis]|uniref:Exo-alpha-sialidase n=1 Tax=Hoyosella altamirensis TaxID=616997 RepID=A0A839RM35_9ACTN|nr:sialidase family protein [Hoyosella altamirensis]MBB3037258.1 hypothetical protein [Hoyosella altamirensis]